jgi:hypothetical protein
MSTASPTRASVDDLLAIEGKAELIGGRIVKLMGTGHRPNRVAGRCFRLLDDWAEAVGRGVAYTDNIIFAVPELPSGRESFSPDASYYVGPLPENGMKPVPGPPTLAIAVRSEGDYGPAAERAMAEKRADYFAAGTAVVWDVDPVAELVRVFLAATPESPTTYGRGHVAEAEPAVPDWRPPVSSLFPTT